jgi:hypothetical protein
MARALPDLAAIHELPDEPPARATGIDLGVQYFPQASLARIEDGAVVAWVRGARPAFNLHHGSPVGSGLVRVWSRKAGEDALARWPLSAPLEGEWSGRCGQPSLGRGLRANSGELRFSAWLARHELRRGRRGAALRAPWNVLRRGGFDYAGPRVGSAWACSPHLSLLSDGVELDARLARRDGTALEESRLVRRFRVDGEGLVVEERLLLDGGARDVTYLVPRRAEDVVVEAREVSWRLA